MVGFTHHHHQQQRDLAFAFDGSGLAMSELRERARDLEFSEVCDELGIPPGTLNGWLYRDGKSTTPVLQFHDYCGRKRKWSVSQMESLREAIKVESKPGGALGGWRSSKGPAPGTFTGQSAAKMAAQSALEKVRAFRQRKRRSSPSAPPGTLFHLDRFPKRFHCAYGPFPFPSTIIMKLQDGRRRFCRLDRASHSMFQEEFPIRRKPASRGRAHAHAAQRSAYPAPVKGKRQITLLLVVMMCKSDSARRLRRLSSHRFHTLFIANLSAGRSAGRK